jgi:hypothetical protein
MSIELPKGTLLLAEKVIENRDDTVIQSLTQKKQLHCYITFFHLKTKVKAIYVIDVYFIEEINQLAVENRIQSLEAR